METFSLALVLTYLGSGYAHLALALLYGWWSDPRGGRLLAVALGASFGLNSELKELFGLPRPFAENLDLVSDAVRATAEGHTWPSGHSQNTAAVWTLLASLQQRVWLWIVAAAVIALVATSRVLLRVHYPADVVGGVLVGATLAAILGFVSHWRSRRLERRAAAADGDRRWLRRLALVVGGLVLMAVALEEGGIPAEAAGLVVGALWGGVAWRPHPDRRRRAAFVVGGLVVVALVWWLVGLGAALLSTGAVDGGGTSVSWPDPLAALAAAWVAFGGWPRLALKLRWAERAEAP